MADEDTYKFQRERTINVVEKNAPGKQPLFNEKSAMISFVVVDPAAPSVLLTEPSGEWTPEQLAKQFPTDDGLWKFIQRLSNGKL